ncbi:MAG: flavodoxin [Eubacterium sp.]|nr:flavodoxin [Eubacterium sp.]
MKRYILSVLFAAVCLAACGTGGQAYTAEQSPTAEINEAESTNFEKETLLTEQTEENTAKSTNTLIAYFTWAENTYVEDESKIDVDATTSASVLPPGNAAKIAGWIKERTGGDLFSIIVTEPYSSNYDECLERAADEKAENARPELLYTVKNMDDYDIVFLGFPNWWYTIPMAVHSFIEAYDFSDKTVIPFVTHGTGGLAETIEDIAEDLPESAVILEPIGVYRPEVDNSKSAVDKWLDELGY